MREPIVSNSTCLIALERIGRLDILPALFEPIWVPPKVQEEFAISLNWLSVEAPRNTDLVTVLKVLVDEGEAEAIALAREKGALLILDDRKARHWARQLGIRLIGTAGVLVKAKRQGVVEAVKPLLEAMQQKGFYISPALITETLHLVGEV